jgi:hypothetical protein
VRYFPKTSFDNIEVGVMGVALQHEFSNYLPFIKKVPFLHLSALVGYTKSTASYKPVFNNAGSSVKNPKGNAVADFEISALTVHGIVSAKFSFLELYTSIGYINGTSNLNLKGDYDVTYQTIIGPQTVTVTDPVALGYKASGITNTWGARVNIFFFKLYADYTFATYNGASIGAAFSFR